MLWSGGAASPRRTIDGGFAAEIVKGGELFVVTPTEQAGKYLSQEKILAVPGFEKLPGEPFLAFGVNKCDISDVWCKDMKPGEKLALGKWALVCGFDLAGQPQPDPADKEKEDHILAYPKGTPSETEAPRDILKDKPDYVVFVPKQPRAGSISRSYTRRSTSTTRNATPTSTAARCT